MTNYILRQTRESLTAKPSLLDEIVESYQGSEAFKVLDRSERRISIDYTGTLEELQKELERFPEVRVSENKVYRLPDPRPKILKPVAPPQKSSKRRR